MTAKKTMRDSFALLVFNRSRPWDDSEFIRVAGNQLVYTETASEGFRVQLPGRKWATVEQLKSRGHEVVMPRVRRID